jgi:hypothetical protein
MKQRFEEEGFTGNLTVDSIGSGAGLERFCVAGETDIANASRAIKTAKSNPARVSTAPWLGFWSVSMHWRWSSALKTTSSTMSQLKNLP